MRQRTVDYASKSYNNYYIIIRDHYIVRTVLILHFFSTQYFQNDGKCVFLYQFHDLSTGEWQFLAHGKVGVRHM